MLAEHGESERRFVGAEEDPVTEQLLRQPYYPLVSHDSPLFDEVVAELPAQPEIDWRASIFISADRSVKLVVNGAPFWIATTDGTAEDIVHSIRSAIENLD